VQQLRDWQRAVAEKQADIGRFTGTLAMDAVMDRQKVTWELEHAMQQVEAAKVAAWSMLSECHATLTALDNELARETTRKRIAAVAPAAKPPLNAAKTP